MKDRNVQYPQRYQLVKVEGTDDIYDLTPAPGEVSEAGTLINKATLLKDATAALYGIGTDAVPDDVLAKLANAAFVENGGLTDVGGNSVGVQIATGSYVGTGTYGASNPNTLTFEFEPKLIIVYGMYISGNTYPFNFYNNPPTTSPIGTPDNFTRGCGLYGTTGGAPFGKYDKSTKTFSWYNTASASAQLNESAVYYYVAIG